MPGVAGVYSSDGGARLPFINTTFNKTRELLCHPGGYEEATVIFTSATLGICANLLLMLIILTRTSLRTYVLHKITSLNVDEHYRYLGVT